MCGIVALLTKKQYGFSSTDTDIFREMLIVDQIRGEDATGSFCVHKNRQVSGIKGAFTPWHLFQTREWGEYEQKAIRTGHILVGHNRKATHGNSANPNNAHPFQEGNIVLVHNGTLSNHRSLAQRDVDSHAVAAAFAEGNYAEVLSKINGAYVFVWYDMARNRLSVVRNDQRPLWKFENKDSILFCSEAWMGNGILRRNRQSMHYGTEKPKPEDFVCTEVPTNKVFSYEVGGNLAEEEDVVKKAVVPVTTPVTGTMRSGGNGTVVLGGHRVSTPTDKKQGAALARAALEAQIRKSRAVNEGGRGAVIPFRNANNGAFKVGDEILIQINEIKVDNANAPENQQLFKYFGTTATPGKPIIDVVGILPSYVTHDAVKRYMHVPLVAKVEQCRTSNCGPSLSTSGVRFPAMVQTWPTGVMAESEWEHIVEHCKCKHCEKRVGQWDNRFTSVRRIYSEPEEVRLEVTCGDCIEEKIADTEVKKEFGEGRIAALQEWEQVQRSTGGAIVKSIAVEGNSTTH